MNHKKQRLLNHARTFALCWLALGCWPLVAYGQEPGKPNDKPSAPAVPEILSVQPVGENGEPHLRPGREVVLIGRNFSPVLSKNRVGLRSLTDNPQTPPPICEYLGEIHLTAATPERLEGVVPLSIRAGYYLLWVRVEARPSQPVKVWLGAQPPPSMKPIIAAIELAR